MNTIHYDIGLQRLIEGNKEYVSEKSSNFHKSAKRRQEVIEEQNPFAVILSCSDSRVPATVIFNQGIGDLFVIRVAGNTIDDLVIGSIEYAVKYLGVQLIMVMGHEKCGAIHAAMQKSPPPGHMDSFFETIRPVIDNIKEGQVYNWDDASKLNVINVVKELSASSTILNEAIKKDKLKIVGSFYHLDSGIVKIIT